MDLADSAAEWLEAARQTRSFKPRTIEGYAYCMGLLVRAGIFEVEELTRERVARFLDDRRKRGIDPSTLNRNLAAVCSFCSALERKGAFRLEGLHGLRRLRYRLPPRRPPFFLTAEKAAQVAAASVRVDPQLERAVAIDLASGVRAGELVTLRHEELKLREERPYLVVARDADRDPKTYVGRTVPLRRADAARLLELGLGDGRSGPVFPAEKKNASEIYLRANTLGRRLALVRILVTDLGGKLDFLALRHTFASLHVQAGTSLYKVSRWLGHRSIRTTEQHYAALAPGGDPDCERAPSALDPQ